MHRTFVPGPLLLRSGAAVRSSAGESADFIESCAAVGWRDCGGVVSL